MDKKLRLLDSFPVQGDDGQAYVVRAYEHLSRLDGMPDGEDQWQPTGQSEYKLASGERVEVDRAGAMTIARTGVRLERSTADAR